MSSYGIVGVNPDSLKVIRDIQQFKNVHVCDKLTRELIPFKNARVYPTVADFSLNMPRPRTIATFINPNDYEHEKTMDQLIEWCDREDTIVNINLENCRKSNGYVKDCEEKGIHYVTGGLSDKLLMVDGSRKVVDSQEIFFRTFSKKLIHLEGDPGTAQLVKSVHEAAECALYQVYAEIYGYFNQDPDIIKVLNMASKTDVNGPILKNTMQRIYEAPKYDDIAYENLRSTWCSVHALNTGVCVPILQSNANARSMSRDMKLRGTKQKFNKFKDDFVAAQTIRFMYAMIYLESTRACKAIGECIQSSTLDCDMFKKEDPYEIIEKTVTYAKTFSIHCISAGIPCPAVQAALCEYYFWTQTKTSMNFIATIRV
jgi:6-phosphogluconate dehydrogenase (decarboxylating)